ncbi:MAG: lipopolysaccharide biosynthesis protein [Solirubrobacterales bacterium]
MFEYLRRLATTGASYSASSVISKLFAVALLPVYTRHLTTADYGAAEVLLSAAVAFSILFRLGIVEALLRYYYRFDEPEQRDRVVRTSFAFLLATTTVGALLIAAFAGPLSEFLLRDRDTQLMLIAVFGLWVFTLYEMLMALFRLDERARDYFLASIANVALTIALTVWLVVFRDEGARGLLLGNFCGSAVIGIALGVIHRRRLALVPSGDLLRPMLRFGLPTMPAELSLYALNFVDRIALTRYVGLAEAGLYALAVKFSQVVTVFARAFNLAWPPLAYSIEDDERARRAYSLIVTYFLLLAATVTLALSLEARWVVRLLAAPEFFDAWKAIPLVSTGVTLYALFLVLSVTVGRIGRTEFNFPVTAAALAVNVALNVALVPSHGIVGAGLALVGAYVVMLTLMYGVTRRLFPLPLEWGRLARIVVLAGALYGLAEALLPTASAVGLLERAALVPAFWALLYVSGFLHAVEVERLRSLGGRLRGREPELEAAEDLEALSSSTDLMDEMHDPQ